MGIDGTQAALVAVLPVLLAIGSMVGFLLLDHAATADPRERHGDARLAALPTGERVLPEGASVLMAAHLLRWRRRSAIAQLIELQRRGVLAIERDEDGWAVRWLGGAPHDLERRLVEALLNAEPEAGGRYRLAVGSSARVDRVRAVQARVNLEARAGVWRARRRSRRALLLIPMGLTLGWSLQLAAVHPSALWALLITGPVLLVSAVAAFRRSAPLTPLGASTRDAALAVAEALRRPPARFASEMRSMPWLRDALPVAVLLGREREWLAHGGSADPLVLQLLQEAGGEGTGSSYLQRGDDWQEAATGGSADVLDGAEPPDSD